MVSGTSARKEIAKELFIAESSVNTHVNHIFQKLDVGTSNEAIIKSVNEGIFNLQIIREIEFSERQFRAGVSILNHFGSVLKQKNPDNAASVKIEQVGLKIRMIIDYKDDSEKEIIEKTLFEYGQLVIGNIDPVNYFPEFDHQIQFETELQIALLRAELENNRIVNRNNLKKLNSKIKSKGKKIKLLKVQRDELRRTIGEFIKGSRLSLESNKAPKSSAEINDSIIYISGKESSALQNLLFNGNIKAAIDLMSILIHKVQPANSKIDNYKIIRSNLNQLSSRHKLLLNTNAKGIIKNEDFRLEENKILNGVSQFIDNVFVVTS